MFRKNKSNMMLPTIEYDDNLPVVGMLDEIRIAIETHQVVVICGETGSGKTTQIPKLCLQIGRGAKGKIIGHTQPRRLAATSVAKRLAAELKSELGQWVGYQIRFHEKRSEQTKIKLMTDGILLAELQNDPLLKRYDTIIIDEAHERSLNIDFLLGFLKPLLKKRRDLKLIVTSATIDAQRFAQHFEENNKKVPIIEVSGRLYPVEIRYRPVNFGTDTTASETDEERDLMDAIVDAVDECIHHGTGDILIFLPGEREIREAAQALQKHHLSGALILPLYARLSQQEQERIFKVDSQLRRIILATNVAETSLTVPGIRFVIDSGLARVKRYSLKNKVEQLEIEPISKASAKQRSGRCGRLAEGVCIRLYDEEDYEKRPEFTDPEILRSSLASVILQMKALRIHDVESFPFIQMPSRRAFSDGMAQLRELNALNDKNQLTPIGKVLSSLPLDPRVGRMILAAKENQSLKEVLVIASALTIQDPRERPLEQRDLAQQLHAKFQDDQSEFMSYLKLWDWYHDAVKHKDSQRKLQQKLKDNFLSSLRLREWHDVHSQILTLIKERGWRVNELAATYEQIHTSLMAGLLGNLGLKILTEEVPQQASYQGARGIKFTIHPSSTLRKKAGKWIMASELVETSKLYARCIANIDPKWIEGVGEHLLQKHYSDPQWYAKQGQVLVNERATLYGLPIYTGRKRQPVDIEQAHEIFIRDALMTGDIQTNLPFLKHNQKIIDEVERLEHRSRRQDILVDDALILNFYKEKIPSHIHKTVALERWYKQLNEEQKKTLLLSKEDLMRHDAQGITSETFPKKLNLGELKLSLSYHFEPGSPKDGVTATVPVYALNQLSDKPCTWLVPGMLKEKVLALLKSLPQKLRKSCVPLPDYAENFYHQYFDQQDLKMDKSLVQALCDDIYEKKRIHVTVHDFQESSLPPHCFMNFKIVDEHGRMLSAGRHLDMLKATHGHLARESLQQLVHKQSDLDKIKKDRIVTWDFGAMPEILEIQKNHQTLMGYAALVDHGDHCQMDVFDEQAQAMIAHQKGLLRLYKLALKDQIKGLLKQIPQQDKLGMLYLSFGTLDDLKEDILDAALKHLGWGESLPHDEESFQLKIMEIKQRLGLFIQEVAKLTLTILNDYAMVQKNISSIKAFTQAQEDISENLKLLVFKGFLSSTPFEQIKHLPRYLQATLRRIDKIKQDPARDQKLMSELKPLWQMYGRKKQMLKGRVDDHLETFFFMLQELRVMLFAQELKTPMPVSVKRLYKMWESLGLA
ncbi:ATP-dependent RNA helicase HrpA [Basilea psittacipulmonis]|uniref:RNA helicase n=1 Tax=Basilea psittacipulmonis DSM 24701 TaxID=1072685 RepID=A0A077DD70_9BURK|nr:ATP-dependent RNA helicase HrpA [Basilea psittacipulmonis]AIL32780.1 ATP-dependent helicase [Basilea psittacipulmonis DSM 24701]